MSHRHDKEKGVNVQVLLRCRPFSVDELRSNAPQVVTCNEFHREVAVSQIIAGKQIDRVFTFDKVFGPSSHQKDLYDQAVSPIVKEVLDGFNCTIFAYGQTGTGKTYTMEGECRGSKVGPMGELPPNAGVIPRAVKQIFETLEHQNAEYSVKISFLELYNEEITDLLAPEEISKVVLEDRQKKTLPLMEDKRGVLVRGLEEEIVTSCSEIFTLLEKGSAKRHTAETLLNKQSSRSHSLFTITIHIKEATPEGDELVKCGKLNLVDLAGSENISRSGAKEGRAREAGEINKSLLTLGRVITALVEHSGHVPYRDSKLTRLLRDSLGGRTKTCIIATVSPAVHCLEETLSTLDYAHRAKNIKNRPEVNQKMMKSTLIKDLYGEIERLKGELHATREKVGVYIPKERYYQEESEKKTMTELVEQMGALVEANKKQIDNLEEKYNIQLHHSSELCKKLNATEKSLEHTSKLLDANREELTRSQYAVREKDFIISELKDAENALTNQAYSLQSDLEKSMNENRLLYSKVARKDQLNASNKAIVNKFQLELLDKVSALCNTVVFSMAEQKKQIQHVEGLCKSCLDFHDTSLLELKRKITTAKVQYASHLEAIQNDVRLQKSNVNSSLDEVSTLACANHTCLEQVLAVGEGVADQIIDNLQENISSQRGEITDFVKDLHQRFHKVEEHTHSMSNYVVSLLNNLGEKSLKLQNHVCQIHDDQTKNIADFQKAFEEQSRLEAEKLISEVKNLVSCHMQRQKELVDNRLTGLRDSSFENKGIFDRYISSMDVVTHDAKRKWESFVMEAENSSQDGVDYASTKHCRMEVLFQDCVASVGTASKQWKETNKSISDLSKEHCAGIGRVVRTAIESNEQHDMQTASACISAGKDATDYSENILVTFDGVSRQEHKSVLDVMNTLESQGVLLNELDKDHAAWGKEIERLAENSLQHKYMDYVHSGDTPVRCDPQVPSKGTIESLRATPMDDLLKEFRENNPYVSNKEVKPSLIPRPPLTPRNQVA